MPEDDDILEAYEAEFDGSPSEPAPRHGNRGFWMVAGTMALGAVILLVEIFAHRPMVNAISRTENGGPRGRRRGADLRRCGSVRHFAGDRQRVRIGGHLGRVVTDRAGDVLLREAGRG